MYKSVCKSNMNKQKTLKIFFWNRKITFVKLLFLKAVNNSFQMRVFKLNPLHFITLDNSTNCGLKLLTSLKGLKYFKEGGTDIDHNKDRKISKFLWLSKSKGSLVPLFLFFCYRDSVTPFSKKNYSLGKKYLLFTVAMVKSI